MMNAKDFKYIDKDKILPFLDNEIRWAKELDDHLVIRSDYLAGYIDAIENIKKDIIDGFFSWNQGSE